MNNTVIGVDFDNTIADYDELMHALALKEGFISRGISADKQKIRDHIRSLDNGETKWQKLQAMAYGKFMPQAKLIEGVRDFFLGCHHQGIPVFIVSHKTQFAAQDVEKVDLHGAALRWIKEKGLGLNKECIFFEPDRQQKIARIVTLGCTHFIDDLEEIFLDQTFPEVVRKILYAPHGKAMISRDVLVKTRWEDIHECFIANIRK